MDFAELRDQRERLLGRLAEPQVQQGTSASAQTLVPLDVGPLRKLIDDLRSLVDVIELDRDEKAEIEAELTTVEAQLTSPRPKSLIVREGLISIRHVLEGAAGGGLAGAGPQLAHFVEQLGHAIAALPV